MNLIDHLEKLKYFYETARVGSMKKASETVFISQPSLTKSIKVLEDAIGDPLFIRKPRGIELTQQGDLLYKYCHSLFASLTDIEQKLSYPEDPMAGSLRVGTYDSIGIYFWPAFLRSFLVKYPQLKFELTTGRSAQMQEQLDSGKLDLILTIEPKETPSRRVETLKKDYFKFYVSTKKELIYSSYQTAPLIVMPSALSGNSNLKDTLEIEGLKDKKLYKTSSLESVRELTLFGIGIGVLPEMVARNYVKKRLLKPIKLKISSNKTISTCGPHKIAIAYSAHRENSTLLKGLIKELKKWEM